MEYQETKISAKRILIAVLLGFFIIILYCSNNIYYPIKKVYETNYSHENIIFNSLDGKKLNGWYVKPKDGKPTILFSHGNGGNICYFFDMLIPVAEKGYGVFIYDYRGYGNSEGFPYENGLYNDLRSAKKFLNTEKETPDKDIILWGLSLGGAVTSKIANEGDFKAVILQNTFTSIKDVGKYTLKKVTKIKVSEHFVSLIPFFQNFNTNDRIDKITEPLLIIHSVYDEMIPYTMSAKLHYKNKNSTLILVHNKDGHNNYEHSLPLIIKYIEGLNLNL